MTSSKLILIFLAFIFFIIVILSSSRISSALRSRFGKMIPSLNPTVEDASLTSTPTGQMETPTSTPTPTVVYGTGTSTGTKGGVNSAKSIPATGPADLVYLVLGGSLFAGAALRKLTQKS